MGRMDDRDGRTRPRTATAYVLLGLAALQVAVGAVALAAAGVSAADVVRYDMVVDLAVGLAYPVCGTVIALHRPRNPIGWLLIAYGLGHAFTGMSIGLAVEGLRLGWSPELLHALTTVGRHTWILGSSTAFVLVFFLFPDGRIARPPLALGPGRPTPVRPARLRGLGAGRLGAVPRHTGPAVVPPGAGRLDVRAARHRDRQGLPGAGGGVRGHVRPLPARRGAGPPCGCCG